MFYPYIMSSMNRLEKEILKYEKKGFTKKQKKTLKYGSRIFLLNKKGFFGIDEGVYIYYVDGSATIDSIRECLKDYQKFPEKDNYNTKGIFLCSGNCDKKLFRDLKKAIIKKDDVRKSLKLIATELQTKEKAKNSAAVSEEKPTKRVRLTAKERIYVWEHPEKYGRTCNICGAEIIKLSDLELDHTIPFSKGGEIMVLAHRDCNRMKGSKNLSYIQSKMKFNPKK